MAKKIIYPLLAAIGIAAASGAAWWYQSKPKTTPLIAGTPAIASTIAGVEVARVEKISLRDDAPSVGSLQSRQSVMLRPEIAGRIKAFGFSDGARVRKGQLLVQLDDQLQQAELKQSQAQLSIAKANHKRNQELVAENFLAQRVLEESAVNLQVVEAQLALSQARLSRMALLAPFDGTVGIRLVNVGDYVKDGADLVNLEDISSLYVDFRLPERYLSRLQLQQTVEVALDAFAGRAFTARVEAMNPLLDANGRSVGVRAVLPNNLGEARQGGKLSAATVSGDAPLRPGMFARVTTVFSVNDAALVVPEEAIVPQAGRQFVIKVVAPASGNANLSAQPQLVSMRQEVTLGVRQQGKVEITEGLAEGQTVVVAGQQRLQRDGTPLRVVVLGQNATVGASATSAPPASSSSPAASR